MDLEKHMTGLIGMACGMSYDCMGYVADCKKLGIVSI